MLVTFSSQHSTTECIMLQYLQCVEGCVSRRSFNTDGQCQDDCVSHSDFNIAFVVVVYFCSLLMDANLTASTSILVISAEIVM